MIPFDWYPGRLVADPEQGGSGDRAYCRFRIAESDNRLDGDGRWEKVAERYIPVVVFGRLVDVASRLRQGESVVVLGKLVTSSWVNDAGENRSRLEVRGHEIYSRLNLPNTDRPPKSGGGSVSGGRSVVDEQPPF